MRANFIPALLLACAFFVAFRAAYLRCSRPLARALIGLIAAALAVPAVLFASNYLLEVPFETWFVEAHSLPGAEISSGLIGAMLGVMFASSQLRPGKLNRPILMFCSALAFGLLIAPFGKQLFFSVDYYDNFKNTWRDGVCVQSGGHTCLPSCCATVLRTLGTRVTEHRMARAMGCTVYGCETWYVRRALRKMGYEPRFSHLKSIRRAPINSILGVKIGSLGHVVVVLAKSERGVTVGEPLIGRMEYTWEKFERHYHPNGFCMVIRKSAD